MKRLLILGVNGFIGHHLSRRVLSATDWQIFGMDMQSERVAPLLGDPRMRFFEGDITINREWIEYHVKKSDVVLPLVAIATPATYVKEPLRVFELDFEANLYIVRLCVKHGKRVLFPSTSEVYGMCRDEQFDPYTSELVYGPIEKQRWIYAASKQLLDRVIYAYGVRDGLDYTLFRPFNWIGPKLDNLLEAKEGSSRVFTQFLSNVLHRKPIQLVDGGKQRRSFTWVGDAIACLTRIIENKDGCATQQIFNIGNPASDLSVGELANQIIEVCREFPVYRHLAEAAKVVSVDSGEYYGKYYQDIQARVPSITAAKEKLGWAPSTDLRTAIRRTLDYHVKRGDINFA
jgi:nucleoside-diphosphate-sugar epimerase